MSLEKVNKKIDELERNIITLQDALIDAQTEIKKLRIENSDLDQRLKDAAQIHLQMQPLYGRMIAALVLLEQKGYYRSGELNKVQEEQAEIFVVAANQIAARRMQDRPQQAGTVASSSRDGRSGLSGSSGDGGASTSDQKSEDRARARITRLSDVQPTHGSNNTTPNTGTSPPEVPSSGQE